MSDRKRPCEGRPGFELKASKLHGTTTLTSLSSLALLKALRMLVAAPMTKG